jgi:hypothetical protein
VVMDRWISLGNQLNGVRLVDEGLRARFRAAYPETEIQPPDSRVKAQDGESQVSQKSPLPREILAKEMKEGTPIVTAANLQENSGGDEKVVLNRVGPTGSLAEESSIS